MPQTQTVSPHNRTAPTAGPRERLVMLAVKAARDSASLEEATASLLAVIGHDGTLLSALIEDRRTEIAGAFIRKVAGVHVKQYTRAKPGQGQTTTARTPEAMQQAANATLNAILDTHMTELGRPVGDLNKTELSALAERTAGRSRFYSALAQSIPPTGVVRDYWTNDEAARVWAQANGPKN